MDKRISEAELDVMEILWRRAPQTATEVANQVSTKKGWSLQTVKTLLSRLVSKSALSHERDGRRFLYSPSVKREDYVADESQRLVDKLFGGRAMPLVAHLAERDALGEDDIAEIERLLRELKS